MCAKGLYGMRNATITTLVVAMSAVLLGVALWTAFPCNPNPSASTPAMTDAECLRDLDCLAGHAAWRQQAETACKMAIEDKAPFIMRWTDEPSASAFTHVGLWPPHYDGVRYMGRDAEFQNAHGAWRKDSYTCVYDSVDDQVVFSDIGTF